MAYQGYLLKVNGVVFPHDLIAYGSYKATPNQIMDIDPYRDGNGVLHRDILEHEVTTIEFNLKRMWLRDKMQVHPLLVERRKVTLNYWNDITNSYSTGNFYIPNITFTIVRTIDTNIFYDQTAVKFVEY